MKAQRLRFRYRVVGPAASHKQRELVGAWEQAVKAAGLALAYSEAKRPAPQISIAAPLPLNVTSDWELIDVFLGERADPQAALAAVSQALPEGVAPLAVEEVGVSAPSLQSQLRWAEYSVTLTDGPNEDDLRQAVHELLAADSLPSEHRRETRVRRYDLRPLVLGLWVESPSEGCLQLAMRLRATPEMTGRADQVLAALGLPPPHLIHRRRLYMEENPPALLAYRRAGQPEEA